VTTSDVNWQRSEIHPPASDAGSPALPASSPCIDTGHYPSLDGTFPHWPSTKGYPDYFMFGDPHNNYYEGFVHYDDLRLEVWKP